MSTTITPGTHRQLATWGAAIWHPAGVPSSLHAALARTLTARSVLDRPLTRRHRIDASQLRALAGVARCGDLGARKVLELPALADLAATTASQLRLPDGAGWRLGQALGHALEQGVRLWLCEVPAEAVPLIERTLGEGLVHLVSLPEPDGVGVELDDVPAAAAPAPDGTVVIALSPLALLLALADGEVESHRYLRTVLRGLDTLRCPARAVRALERVGVEVVQRPQALRLVRNPVALAYLVVFVYSSLRALPVAFVPGFQGRVWVLWLLDVLTAVPYTWGIVEMVAGRRIRHRLLGLAVTIVTFVIPYVYFWSTGRDYPTGVIVTIVAMVLGTIALEGARWWRDHLIVQGLEGAERAGTSRVAPPVRAPLTDLNPAPLTDLNSTPGGAHRPENALT